MNILKKIGLLSVLSIVLVGCTDRQARHPVSKKTSTFLKESAVKSKALLAKEQALIDDIIKEDTLHTFSDSQHEFKFCYLHQSPEADYTAQSGNIVTYDYGLSDLNGNELYQEKSDGEYRHHVDKEGVFQSLHSALKLLKEKEGGVFFFPSSVAYGYRDDKNKTSYNQPIIAKIEVFKIERNPEKVLPRPE